MTLRELKIGESAVVTQLGGEGALRQHFLDMGMIPGAEVTVQKMAPMGDPMELKIHGYELTLRLADAEKIQVEKISEKREHPLPEKKHFKREHPGLGEGGKYHEKSSEHPLPDGTVLTYALVGNQNCGKTTLFNQLTGSNQHVGNFPGVTVDRKDGAIKGHPDTLVTDLPGIYSMSPYSSEEIVSRNFVLNEMPKAIINIVDATNIERNLYLTMQLLEMNIPMVVALNMMDEVTGNSGSIDINGMEALLGVPVIPISAAKNEGVDELVRHALHIAKYQERPTRQDFCDENDYDGAVHRCIHAVIHLIEDHARRAKLPVRFAASKAIEGDSLILEQLALDQNEKEMLEHIVLQLEKERGLDRNAAIADMRFSFIEKVCRQTVVKPKESKEHSEQSSLSRTKQKIYNYAFSNDWSNGLFFTITFDPKQVDSFDYDKCCKRLHQFLKNIKDQNPDFKYIFVPEFHKSGRIHFHGIGTNCDRLKLEDSGIKKNGKKIYNVNSKTFRYGFTTVSKIEDTQKVSSYITKYITKEMITATKGKHRYLCSRNLDTAEVENIMLDDVENFMKSVELNPKVCNQKKYTNEETGQEITYIKVKK